MAKELGKKLTSQKLIPPKSISQATGKNSTKLSSPKITNFMSEDINGRNNKRRRTSDSSPESTDHNKEGDSDEAPHTSTYSPPNKGHSSKKTSVSLATQTPKNKSDWENLDTCVDTFPSVCFQDDADKDESTILPAAIQFWRDVRTSYDNFIRTGLRSAQLEYFQKEKIYPAWAYGWAPLPRYISRVPTELVQLKQNQAKDFIHTLQKCMRDEAINHKIRAKAYQGLVRDVYRDNNPENKYDLDEAERKTNQLLARDLDRYTAETDRFTEKQEALPRLTEVEVAKVTLKGPIQFSKLLANFSTESKKKDEKKDKARNKAAPYPKGKGGRKSANKKY